MKIHADIPKNQPYKDSFPRKFFPEKYRVLTTILTNGYRAPEKPNQNPYSFEFLIYLTCMNHTV